MTRFLACAMLLALLVATPFSAARADEPRPAAAPVDLQNTRCPVSGMAVKPGVVATVDGMTVHFCSPDHAARYREDPAAYEAALRKEPAVAKRMEAAHAGAGARPPGAPTASDEATELHDALRKLWEDHVTWTRVFVISALADLPDKDAATKRLLRNQEDIGNAIKPYYGDDAGTKLTALLKEHITIAADLVGALKDKDSEKAEAARQKWSANADEIAAFLGKANPDHWPLDAAKAMMHEHLDLTSAQVKARLDGDWEADVAAYDEVHDQALKMADMLCEGIKKQFPAKFR